MKRENILAMADSYMNRYTEGYPFTKDTVFAAYVEGASRANYEHAKVWHKASDEPQGKDWRILCQDECGGCWVENKNDAIRLHNTWNEYVAIELVVKWAYIRDLLPKGGEE